MEDVVKRSFYINLKVLRILGLYVPDKSTYLYKLYGCVLLICSLVPDPLFGFIYLARSKESDIMMQAGFNLFLLVAMACFVPKLLPFIVNSGKMKRCIHYMETSIIINLNSEQKKIVDDCIRISRRNSIFFFVCVTLDSTTWTSRSLFLQNGELPMEVWLPFDPTKNRVVFYFTYFLTALGIMESLFVIIVH
jgi:hypothetical protein